MKKFWTVLKGIYYALNVLLRPSKSIKSLIKVGNLIGETKAFEVALERVKEDEGARHLIKERYSKGFPSLEELKTLPENTLGYKMYQQIASEGLDVYPTVDMSPYTEKIYLRERRREIHDVLHVVLGFDTSLIGEASLNLFLAAQSAMPVCLLIPAGVVIRFVFKQPDSLKPLLNSLEKAWSWGKKANSPFGLKWEELLDKDVEV